MILLQDLVDTLDQNSIDDFAAIGVVKITVPHNQQVLVSDGAKSARVTIDKTGLGNLTRSNSVNDNTAHASKLYKRSDQIIVAQGTPLYLQAEKENDWKVLIEIDNSTSIFTENRLTAGYVDDVENISSYNLEDKIFISAVDSIGEQHRAIINPANNNLEFDTQFSGKISYLVIL